MSDDPVPSHIDVLPSHPRPGSLESLTGYLTRLAEGNRVRTVDALSTLCFANQDRRIPREQADCPPRSLAPLAVVSACPESVLLATTFHDLAVKFGRSTAAQPLSRFLTGSVAHHRRYCPRCLAESESYLLPWRFLSLEGCARHGLQLLDACGHCGRRIPLLAAPLRIGVCPTCMGDLRTCAVTRLSPPAWRVARAMSWDLAFLLSRDAAPEDDRERVRYIGRRLGRVRRARTLLAADMARQLAVSLTRVEGMERGNVAGRGASFADYVAYIAHLGLSMRDLFTSALEEGEIGVLIDESTAIA